MPRTLSSACWSNTIFSIEMLAKLAEIGFAPEMHRVHGRLLGIDGDNGFVFVAVKSSPA